MATQSRKPTKKKKKTHTPGERFDPADIAGILPEGFEAKPNSQGNVQCLLENLAQLNDYQKCRLLVAAADALYEAGIISDPEHLEHADCPVSLSWKTKEVTENGSPIFRPFPKLWVNQPTKETTQRATTNRAASEAAELGQKNSEQISQMGEMLSQLIGQLSNPAPSAPPAKSDDTDELPF